MPLGTSDTVAFITSNTGSLFEDKSVYQRWKAGMKVFLDRVDSVVVVLTLQEFGGKGFLEWDDASWFFSDVYDSFSQIYPTFMVCCDGDMKCNSSYTALCTIVLIKSSITDFEVYNFTSKTYDRFSTGFHLHRVTSPGDICIKQKFPITLFPNAIWSRKGFMINRFRINCMPALDVVNLHLIHDSNCLLTVETPTVFEKYRRLELEYILEELDKIGSSSAVLLGDFNFRTSFLHLLSVHNKEFVFERESVYTTDSKLYIRDSVNNETLASVSSKEIRLNEELIPRDKESLAKHRKSDREFDTFNQTLFELPITFLPTYCYAVKTDESTYDRKRCPSWCDRIIFKGRISKAVSENSSVVSYDSLSLDKAVGDHKPVAAVVPFELV